jgi:chromosome segregation ATPase
MAGIYQTDLRNTPFRYFAYRDDGGVLRQNMRYQQEDDPTLSHMASLNFGLERRLVAVTAMLEEARHLYHHYQDRVETLEERLVEANTTLAAVNAAREAAETATEEAIIAAEEQTATETMLIGEAPEQPMQDPAPSAPVQRTRSHARWMVTRKKKCERAKKRRLTLQAVAPPPLALPAPSSAQEEQADQSQEEEDPEERVPATPEAEAAGPSTELHFVPAPEHPYAGPEQFWVLDE